MNKEWISTKEKMPETRQRVLFSCGYINESVQLGIYVEHYETEICKPCSVFISDNKGFYHAESVKYWIPLPLNPKDNEKT